MTRTFLTALAMAGLCVGAAAADAPVRLTVRPTAAPKPALKYQLLPEIGELNPGNSIQWYLRCFAEQRNFFFSKEAVAQRTSYLAMPLAELPAKDLLKYGGNALRQADWAARLDTVDWQITQRVQNDGMDLLLPEQGPLQILGIALQVRFRAQVAAKHFDDAIGTAKTMFALARHLGEHPTEVANLGGLSVAHLAAATLEEMVQQPGCPNLYWALTDLPSPLVDLRKGAQGDRTLIASDLRSIRDDAPMAEAELDKVVSRLSGVMGFAREQTGLAPRSLRTSLAAMLKGPSNLQAARAHLTANGSSREVIDKLPPAQVLLLSEKHKYEVQRDERVKLLSLAPWQIDALPGVEELERNGDGLFADILPPIIKARRAQGRLEQRIALLRHVEALRLYAAEHDGKLPEKLSDITVPLPVDPFTGKPFCYKVQGTTAHLQGTPPRGEEKSPVFNVSYEVTVQK
jgi:hypothetical protein